MSISPAVQLAVDEIHRERNALAAAAAANALQATQIADLNAKIAAIPVGATLSDDDKKALLDAVNNVGDTNAALAVAVPANIEVSAPIVAPAPLPDDPLAPRPDPIAGTGQSGTVPLMPNSSFDPSAGAVDAGNAGQPAQAVPIATAGGFVVSGGGNVQRAPATDAPVTAAPAIEAGEGDPFAPLPPPSAPDTAPPDASAP